MNQQFAELLNLEGIGDRSSRYGQRRMGRPIISQQANVYSAPPLGWCCLATRYGLLWLRFVWSRGQAGMGSVRELPTVPTVTPLCPAPRRLPAVNAG